MRGLEEICYLPASRDIMSCMPATQHVCTPRDYLLQKLKPIGISQCYKSDNLILNTV